MVLRHITSGLSLVALLALVGCGSSSREVVLASFGFDNAGMGSGAVATHVEIRLAFSDDAPYEMAAFTPPLAGGETDISYETLPSAGATEASIMSRLTNGIDEELGVLGWYVPSGGGGGTHFLESVRFATRHPDLTGVDLEGATVTRVLVRIDSSSFVAGDPHSYDVSGTVIVLGTID